MNVRITLGMQDFSGAEKKTATDAYVEAASTAPLVFHVTTEAGDDYSYPMNDARTALVVHKANLGRGIRQKRLQFAVSGTDVRHIADVVVLVNGLKRRV